MPGRQRYRRAWGSLPAASGPPWRGIAVQLPLQLEMHGRMVGSRLERKLASFQVASAPECRFGRRWVHEQDLALSRGGEGCIRSTIRYESEAPPPWPLLRLPSATPLRGAGRRWRLLLRLSSDVGRATDTRSTSRPSAHDRFHRPSIAGVCRRLERRKNHHFDGFLRASRHLPPLRY